VEALVVAVDGSLKSTVMAISAHSRMPMSVIGPLEPWSDQPMGSCGTIIFMTELALALVERVRGGRMGPVVGQ
jgi:hypothetical protein